jgi:spermidine synthase
MKNALLFLAFIEGGLVMLLELLVPSITMPLFGKSIVVWAILISISVGALAFGYFLGGFLVRKGGDYKKKIYQLFFSNGILLVCGLSVLLLMNSSMLDSYVILTIFIVCVVLFVPLVLFGATTPLIIQVTKAEIGEAVVGNVFFYSTIGGVLFCLGTGFYFIPYFGVTKTLILATLLAFMGSLFYYYKNQIMRLLHGGAFIGLIALLLIEVSPLPDTEELKVLHQSEGINGQLLVFDWKANNFETRMLLINRMGQTWVTRNNYAPIWSYAGILTNLCSVYPENSSILLLGLGGGAVARTIAQVNGQYVDAVEFDKRIIDVADDFFGLKDYRHKISVFYDDARRYVKATQKKYNIIIVDAFNGEIAPSHVLSKEAISEMMNRLKKGGAILINFNGFVSEAEGISSRSLYATLKDLGLTVNVFTSMEEGESNRNLLFAITQQNVKVDWSKSRFQMQFAGKVFTPEEFRLDTGVFLQGTSYIITDDLPIMETLNRHAAKQWREGYLNNFTLVHKQEFGLPLVR